MTDNVRMVLVETHHPGNLGAAARAMKCMGLQRLVLVAPHEFPSPEATTMASGADDVLDAAEVHTSLTDALRDCCLVIGTSARRRRVAMPELTPREAAQRLVAAQSTGPVALVFGRERTGLENHELQLCHAAVCIPANPLFSSLNVAAAVQVLAYEVHLATLELGATPPATTTTPATHGEVEELMGQLNRMLEETSFHKARPPDAVSQRLRRLLLRANPDAAELKLLRAVLAGALTQFKRNG